MVVKRKKSSRTRMFLGWGLAGVSLLHAVALLWGAATWSTRLEADLEPDFGDLAPLVQENWPVRGAPTEFLMAVLAALACVGWLVVALRGRAPAFLKDWRGTSALIGGGAVCLTYAAATFVPLTVIISPREFERIPSWDALGTWGDASFLLMFLLDAVVVALWTLKRWRQREG